MTSLLLMLILAIVSQNYGVAARTRTRDRFTLNPIPRQNCTDFDPFISSTEFEGKIFLHPWNKDERKGDWYQNRGYCAKHCAEMVTLDSEEENAFFHQFMRNVGMFHPGSWLGAQINDKNEISHWSNGQRLMYSPKAPGEYNEEGLTCLTVGWENDKNWWRNYYCRDDRYLIACQKVHSQRSCTQTSFGEICGDCSPQGDGVVCNGCAFGKNGHFCGHQCACNAAGCFCGDSCYCAVGSGCACHV